MVDRTLQLRSGAVTVEMAFVLPIVFLMFFSMIEFSRVVMLRHTLDNAAYEAARVGIVPGATSDMVRTRADHILSVVRAKNYEIEIFPNQITDETDQISVLISAPVADNGYGITRFFRNTMLKSTCTKARLAIASVVPSEIPEEVKKVTADAAADMNDPASKGT